MKVLITGANGFVGKNLIDYLNKHDLHDIVILPRQFLVNVDASMLTDIDVIIHLAGKAHDIKNVSDSKEYYKVNFDLTKKLYDAFLISSASKFIFVSSVKAVADSVKGILTELDIPNPQTSYGKSKLMAENYIVSQHIPKGKLYFILRPCMIHGPGNKGNLTLLYQFVNKGIPYPLAAFNNKRSFLSVENLCFVIKSIIVQSNIRCGIYHIADDEALSTKELVTIIAHTVGKKAKLWTIPVPLINIFAGFGSIIGLPLNTERLNKLTESFCVSNQKIVKELGKKMPVNAIKGLETTITSFNIKNQ